MNMDEAGARIGCPGGENIVVPTQINELYTSSPENRKSITIIETVFADGREPLPPFIITPGHKIMDNWITTELVGTERLACSPTGYTNNEIALEYLDHLIQYSRAGPEKPWKLLLLDGHESHRTEQFQLRAVEHHIKLFYFPSHLTHILQPLDVGVFRPWKHYHEMAVQAALRSLDFEYTITSFFRDLTHIRSQTMRQYTIINAFKTSGMWPPSAKAGLKKMQEYRKRRQFDGVEEEELELPKLLPTRPDQIWDTTATLRAFADRDPTQFSEPSIQLFHNTMNSVQVQLQKSYLLTLEHTTLQTKIREERKRKMTSRRSVHKGGPSASAQELRARIQARDKAESKSALRKAQRALTQAKNKARNKLKIQGIQARKDNRARLERIRLAGDSFVDVKEFDPIREPDKNPTPDEAERCTDKGYPELVAQIGQLETDLYHSDSDDDSVEFILGPPAPARVQIPDYLDSSPPPPVLRDSSDIESIAGSIDSIQGQMEFLEEDFIPM